MNGLIQEYLFADQNMADALRGRLEDTFEGSTDYPITPRGLSVQMARDGES